MASVSYSVEVSVDDRLEKYRIATNKNRKVALTSRTDCIDNLLQKAGF